MMDALTVNSTAKSLAYGAIWVPACFVNKDGKSKNTVVNQYVETLKLMELSNATMEMIYPMMDATYANTPVI